MVHQRFTVAFYNIENLFDTHDDPRTLDDDFTPDGKKRWNEHRYRKKIYKLGRAIAAIGSIERLSPPMVIGLSEVENKKVLRDLVNSRGLAAYGYDFVHFESPDERGIDTALLYRKEFMEIVDSEQLVVMLNEEDGSRDYTRDILFVRARMQYHELNFYVNHWPSKRSGEDETEPKRIAAAQRLLVHLENRKKNSLMVISW